MIRVYVDVVGDLFHVGHINLLERAKSQGDFLIVGVHSDASTAQYKRTPIISEEDRYKMVSSCRYVDEVIEDAPLCITLDFLASHNIDLVIHGDDFNEIYKNQHSDVIKEGKMKYLPYTPGISTTKIIDRVLNLYQKKEKL